MNRLAAQARRIIDSTQRDAHITLVQPAVLVGDDIGKTRLADIILLRPKEDLAFAVIQLHLPKTRATNTHKLGMGQWIDTGN